jgi:DNA-binding Lrp family transcriptional regulator
VRRGRVRAHRHGINFFAPADKALLHALQNPRANIAGIRRSQLLPHLGMFSPTRLSRHLRQLLDLGVIKRVTGTYRYYLTKAGCAAKQRRNGSPRRLSFRLRFDRI